MLRSRRPLRDALPHRPRHPRLARDSRAEPLAPGRRRRLRRPRASARPTGRPRSPCCRSTSRPIPSRGGCSRSPPRLRRLEVLLLTPPGWRASPRAPRRSLASGELLAGFCAARARAGSRRPHGLERRRLRSRRARRASPDRLGMSPRARARPRRRCACVPTARLARARQATIPGRVVLDGIDLLRGAFVRMDGLRPRRRRARGPRRGQDASRAADRAEEILRPLRRRPGRASSSTTAPTRGSRWQILEKLHLVELAVERSRLTGLPVDRVSSSIAAFDFLYLSELERRGVVAPSVSGTRARTASRRAAGTSSSRVPGLYANVVGARLQEPLPEPHPHVPDRPAQPDPCRARGGRARPTRSWRPNGAAFAAPAGDPARRCSTSSCPCATRRKRAGDAVKSHAIKILMNSFYGVLGTPACRFYDPRLANAITGFGREILLWCRTRIEAAGLRVLYGDTDSLFVRVGSNERRRRAPARRDASPRSSPASSPRTSPSAWRVESRLELEFDRLYLRLCLPRRPPRRRAARASATPASPGGRAREPRSSSRAWRPCAGDWTALAKRRPAGALRAAVRGPARGGLPARGRRRSARRTAATSGSSTARRCASRPTPTRPRRRPTSPPRGRSGRKRRGRVAYVMTTAGPEPLGDRQAPDRPRALRRQAGAAGRGARARPPGTGLRTGGRDGAAALALLSPRPPRRGPRGREGCVVTRAAAARRRRTCALPREGPCGRARRRSGRLVA